MIPLRHSATGSEASSSERRLIRNRTRGGGGGGGEQFAPDNEYLNSVGEGVGASPERYYWQEGMKRSRYSQRRIDDFHSLSRGSERQLHYIEENRRPQQQAMQEAAWMHRKYSIAIQRASARDRRLGRSGMTYPGAEAMMNRGMMGTEHHAQNLYGLDAMYRRVYDRKSNYDALESTERRYPLSRRDVRLMRRRERREEAEEQEGQPDEGGQRSSSRETQGERVGGGMPEVIKQLMLAVQQIMQKISDMERKMRGEVASPAGDVQKGIKEYVDNVAIKGEKDSDSGKSLKALNERYRKAGAEERDAIFLGVVKAFRQKGVKARVSIDDDEIQVTNVRKQGPQLKK
jgi:hypothetical protein